MAHLTEEAQVHIYAAKAFSWGGKFSLHTWLATKEKDADSYIVYHVLLWGTYYGEGVVVNSIGYVAKFLQFSNQELACNFHFTQCWESLWDCVKE